MRQIKVLMVILVMLGLQGCGGNLNSMMRTSSNSTSEAEKPSLPPETLNVGSWDDTNLNNAYRTLAQSTDANTAQVA